MEKTVMKRDGRVVPFDRERITSAITKALKSVGGEDCTEKINNIAREVEDSVVGTALIETVQDMVEKELIASGLPDVAKAYILYRKHRSDIREGKTKLMNVISTFFDEKETKESTHRENANINAKSVSGAFYRIGSEASKEFYSKHMIPEEFAVADKNAVIHIHDRDYYGLSFNCMQHDLSTMYKRGFSTGNAYITEPQGIDAAMALTCVVLQGAQTDLFGGEAVPAWDYYMEPYVEKTFTKHFKTHLERLNFAPRQQQEKYLKENHYQEHTPVFEDDNLYKAYSWAKKDTERDAEQSAQAMVFNLNSLASRSGGQVVFSSISIGTCVKPGGRLASKSLLHALDEGIGHGVTALFPITIFKLKDGVSYKPGDTNYDLRLLAERVAAKRMFPTWDNLDAPFNLQYYKEGHPETEAAYMGCAAAWEQVCIKDSKGDVYLYSLSALYDRLKKVYCPEAEDKGSSCYVQLKDSGIEVFDSNAGGFVKCKGILRNPDRQNWYEVSFTDGRCLTVTGDHPLPVVGKGRTLVRDLEQGDKVPFVGTTPVSQDCKSVHNVDKSWLLGLLLCDGCYASSVNLCLGMDEKDVLDKAENIFNAQGYHTKITERHRGPKGTYIDLYVTGKQHELREELRDSFSGVKKADRSIPYDILSWSRECRMAFLAGMIDADGYVNKSKKAAGTAYRVQLGSTNRLLAIQQMLLAQSLDMPAKVYPNRYKAGSDCIRYRVEFGCTSELIKYIVSEKKNVWDAGAYCSNVQSPEYVEVVKVEKLEDFKAYSYDLETESDRFDLSGINSHNCRTRAISNVNGPEIVTGRGNLSFTTIGLPHLALEALDKYPDDESARMSCFMKRLDEVLDLAKRQLFHRYDIQKNRHVYNFPYVMMQGAYIGSEYLEPTDTIEKAIKNGTLTIGYVGLAEALTALTGHDHADGEEYQQLGLQIIHHMREFCDKVQEDTHMNFSLMATPAESVAGVMLRRDREQFGIVKGVTDKEYYTNSNHIPVYKKIRASEKIRLEAPYHALTNAGHILYIELEGDPTKNPDALHTLINQAHDAGAGYFAFNCKMDCCTNCGFVGLIDDVCPSCGMKETPQRPFVRPRRITGYLSYLDRFNDAKRAEEHDRVTHA